MFSGSDTSSIANVLKNIEVSRVRVSFIKIDLLVYFQRIRISCFWTFPVFSNNFRELAIDRKPFCQGRRTKNVQLSENAEVARYSL